MKTSLDLRNIYPFAIFILGLYMVLSLVQIGVEALAGFRFYLFNNYYMLWFILTNSIALVLHLILMWYFHHKKYRMAFLALVTSFIVTAAYTIVTYRALSDKAVWDLVPRAAVVYLSAGLLYSLSLFTSKTRHRPWLFRLGIIQFLLLLILIVLQLWSMNTINETILITFGKIVPWLLTVLSLALVCYILNFKEEIDLRCQNDDARPSKRFKGIQQGLGVISAIVILLVLSSAFSEYSWQQGKEQRSRELAEDFEAGTYIGSQNDTLRYRLLIPRNYDENEAYPLVVNLHHGGGVGTDNLIQLDATPTAQLLSTEENRKKYPAFIFLPQSPANAGFGGVTDDPGISRLTFEAIDHLEKAYTIDDKRRYVIGMSLGGYGSWYLIGAQPEKFAAAVPICGGGDPAMAPKLTTMPIWAFHGTADKAVPVEFTRNMIEAIREAGGNAKYTEFADGHLIWDKVQNTPGLLDWLFSQKRSD